MAKEVSMNINGISYGPPQAVSTTHIVQRTGTAPVAAEAIQESAPVELSPAGSAVSGPTGFARTGIAAYSSIAA
jgi:hypothetical protein